jgi:hypothetical protein
VSSRPSECTDYDSLNFDNLDDGMELVWGGDILGEDSMCMMEASELPIPSGVSDLEK